MRVSILREVPPRPPTRYNKSMRKPIIGVMGPGSSATNQDVQNALELGKLIAQQDWVLLTGGRNSGVMDAVNKGAKSADGLTVGIMFDQDNSKISKFVDIPVMTSMGSARNNINALTSDIVIACGTIAPGTLSEIALALKGSKQVVLLNDDPDAKHFLGKVGQDNVSFAASPEDAIEITKNLLQP